MKLIVTITAVDGSIKCDAGLFDEPEGADRAELNLWAIGAIEIAKASLLANRWGLNIGGLEPDPLVKQPEKAMKIDDA